MVQIKLISKKAKTFLFAVAAELFPLITGILTSYRPVTIPSCYQTCAEPGSFSVDNNFDTLSHTAGTEIPWLSIILAESAVVKTVVVIQRPDCCWSRIGTTSIRVGTNANPNSNEECKSIDRDGVFACTTPLTGNYVGVTRTAPGTSEFPYFHFAEIRAYTWVPFDQNISIISADVMPNTSLLASVMINEPLPTFSFGGIRTDDLFSTGPATNCWWMMNLGQ